MNRIRAGNALFALLSVALATGAFPEGALSEGAPKDGGADPAASPYRIESTIDWTERTLRMTLSLDLAADRLRLPGGRVEAERRVERDLPGFVRDVAAGIRVDSYRTVGSTVIDNTILPGQLMDFLRTGKRVEAHFTRDFSAFVASYVFRLDALAALYTRHATPLKPALPMASVPTRPYSGILISVVGAYPVHGEHRDGVLVPCLFPRIFDETMRPVLERNFSSPAVIASKGVVAYARGPDEPWVEGRIGDNPLRIVATAIFGSARTDVILAEEDALRILCLPANTDLVREGRIVIVTGESAVSSAGGEAGGSAGL